jgi:hypothetical protein
MMAIAAAAATGTSVSWWGPLAGLAGVLGAALVSGLFVWAQARRDRRRKLYSEAYKAAMSWVEMLYRVRRRCEGQDQELIRRFHDVQDEISYYEGWLTTESPALGRSYRRLVAAVREATSPLIQEAWAQPIRAVDQHTRADDGHPSVRAVRRAFLLDAREHLSLRFWVHHRVEQRNPEPGHTGLGQRIVARARHPRGRVPAISVDDRPAPALPALQKEESGGA